jgi:hypothetical protein
MAFDFIDPTEAPKTATETGVSLSQQAFNLAKQSHELRDVGIAAGSGFLAGSGLTAAGEYGLMKMVEPVARPVFAVAFGAMGGGRVASQILNGPAMTFAECVTPKHVVVGGLIAAGLVAGGYEFYKHVYQNSDKT